MVTHLVSPLKLNIVTAPQDHGKNHPAKNHPCPSWFHIVCVGITPKVCDVQLSRARKRHCPECDQLVTVRNKGKLYSHGPINNRCSISRRSATVNSATVYAVTATFDFCNFDTDNFIEFWKVCKCSTLKFVP